MEITSFCLSGPPFCALVSMMKLFESLYEIRPGNSLQKFGEEE